MYTVSRLEFTTKIVGQQMVVKLMQHNLHEQFGEIAGLTQICSFGNCLRQGHLFVVVVCFFRRGVGGGGGGITTASLNCKGTDQKQKNCD